MSPLSIEKRADFGFIRYGMVWEDADLLCRALKPVAAGKRLLSIASAGDNCLALLSLDPKEIVAVDLNPAQLACLDLRLAAFQTLSYDALLGFLGVREQADRRQKYEALRKRLQPWSQDWWDRHPDLVEGGVIHAGKLERFLKGYRWWLGRFVPAGSTGRRWRLLNRLAFSRQLLGRLGRDPEFFKHASKDVTSGPNERLDLARARHDADRNPYLAYHLTGTYGAQSLPLYLRPQHFKALRQRSGRIRFHLGPVESAPGRYSGFNLSNIFEYMAPEQHAQVYGALLDKAQPGARLAYWNLHVERGCPDLKRARPLKGQARDDQMWAYRSFHVDGLQTNQRLRKGGRRSR